MDIRKMILDTLIKNGCTFGVRDGIVYVLTPEGKTWDFTVPMEVLPK